MLPNVCLRSVKMAVVRHTLSFVFDSVYNLEPHFVLL